MPVRPLPADARLDVVSDATRSAFDRLMQCYEAEFSAITRKVPDASGCFALDTHIGDGVQAFLYRVDGAPAGFGMVHVDPTVCEVCEFYIVPSFRQQQHGRALAHALFERFPGAWVVKQIGGADRARDFWRGAIGNYTGGAYTEDIYQDAYWGSVTRQRFTATAA